MNETIILINFKVKGGKKDDKMLVTNLKILSRDSASLMSTLWKSTVLPDNSSTRSKLVGFFSSLPVFACNTQMRIRNQTSSSTFRIVDTRSNVRNQISNHVHMIRYIPRTSRNSMRPAGMIHTRRGKWNISPKLDWFTFLNFKIKIKFLNKYREWLQPDYRPPRRGRFVPGVGEPCECQRIRIRL